VLSTLAFTAEHIPLVADFYCGEQSYALEVVEWIKCTNPENSAIEDLTRPGNRVWLYLADDHQLVGFGSLGHSQWRWPGTHKKDPYRQLSTIPNVAVHSNYQGRKLADDETYADFILDHLIGQAEKDRDERPLLGLCVHPDNQRAIHFYEKAGFTKYPSDYKSYKRMILSLT